MLVEKPIQTPDLNIEIFFEKNGLKTKLFSKNRTMDNFISYEQLFLSRIK